MNLKEYCNYPHCSCNMFNLCPPCEDTPTERAERLSEEILEELKEFKKEWSNARTD